MDQEIETIVKAIESLKQDNNVFKDYFFPLASAFFTSLLGGGVAYLTIKHQDKIQIEKDKINAANKWILLIDDSFSSLMAIKRNYHGKLTDNPIQRLAQIPTILKTSSPIIEDLTSLSFIAPNPNNNSSETNKWSQLPRIRTVINNYNNLLEYWEKRNQLDLPIKKKIIQEFSDNSFANTTVDQVIEFVDPADLSILIGLNEFVIKLTDDLIIELNDFLLNFPKLAKSLIQTKKLEKYGSVLNYSNQENEILLNLLQKSPEVNYDELSKLFGQTADEIKNQNRTGYE